MLHSHNPIKVYDLRFDKPNAPLTFFYFGHQPTKICNFVTNIFYRFCFGNHMLNR